MNAVLQTFRTWSVVERIYFLGQPGNPLSLAGADQRLSSGKGDSGQSPRLERCRSAHLLIDGVGRSPDRAAMLRAGRVNLGSIGTRARARMILAPFGQEVVAGDDYRPRVPRIAVRLTGRWTLTCA